VTTHFVAPKSVVLSIKVRRFAKWNGEQMSICTLWNTGVVKRKVRINRFPSLVVVVVVVLLGRSGLITIVVVDDLLDASCLLLPSHLCVCGPSPSR
jgi:membrane-associated PAP2 superfamily phosphatase